MKYPNQNTASTVSVSVPRGGEYLDILIDRGTMIAGYWKMLKEIQYNNEGEILAYSPLQTFTVTHPNGKRSKNSINPISPNNQILPNQVMLSDLINHLKEIYGKMYNLHVHVDTCRGYRRPSNPNLKVNKLCYHPNKTQLSTPRKHKSTYNRSLNTLRELVKHRPSAFYSNNSRRDYDKIVNKYSTNIRTAINIDQKLTAKQSKNRINQLEEILEMIRARHSWTEARKNTLSTQRDIPDQKKREKRIRDINTFIEQHPETPRLYLLKAARAFHGRR